MATKKKKPMMSKKAVKKSKKTPAKKATGKAKPKSLKSRAERRQPAAKKSPQKPKPKTAQKKKTTSPVRPKAKVTGKKIRSKEKKSTSSARLQVVTASSAPKTSAKRSEEERNALLRKSLIRKREELVKEVKIEISKYIKGETRQLVDTALDDGDWSIVDLSEDISLRQLGTHRQTLLKIDEALRKLAEGTYGICEDCGEPISKERLKVLPFATHCIDCQERREQIEEMERREGIG
jgi:DnaK suppressor protein